MQRTPAPWKRRRARYEALIGIGKRARRYCGNCVWYEVVNRTPQRTQKRRAAIPSGPSVAMCSAWGAKSRRVRSTCLNGKSDRRISG